MTVFPKAFIDIPFPWVWLSLLFLVVASLLLGRVRRVYMLPLESFPVPSALQIGWMPSTVI